MGWRSTRARNGGVECLGGDSEDLSTMTVGAVATLELGDVSRAIGVVLRVWLGG